MTKTEIAVDKKAQLNALSVVESARIDTREGKILAARAEAYATGYETLTDEFRVTVKTVFSAVILTPDNTIDTREEIVESVCSVSQKGISGSTKAYFCATVKNCVFSENGSEITADEIVDGWYIREQKTEVLSPDEDVICRVKKEKTNRFDLFESRLDLSYVDEMRMPVKSVLDCSATALVSAAYPSAGAVRVEGEITVRLIALSDNDQYLTQTFSHPFGTDITADFSDEDTFDVDCSVVRCSASLSDDDVRGVSTELEAAFYLTTASAAEIDVVTDCYSVDKEIRTTENTLVFDDRFCSRTLADKASVVLSGNVVNEIYACLYPSLREVKAYFEDGLNVEGTISAAVLYADENNLPAVKEVKIPFSAHYNGDYDCSYALFPSVSIKSASARLKTASDIEVSAEYAVTTRGVGEKTIRCLFDAAVLGDKEPEDAAICLYPVKPGEDLFDVAKALNTKEDVLLRLNPDLQLPLAGGEKVLLYREWIEE